MTAHLSQERREIIKQTANHIISREDTSEHSENLKAVAELALLTLAGMDSEPVAYADPQAFRNFKAGAARREWMWRNPGEDLIPVFTAPPAPVAVDEIAEQAGIDPDFADAYMQGYHDAESRKPAPVAVPDALEQFALFMAEEAIKSGEYNNGWRGKASNAAHEYAQACRAAMQSDVTLINEGDNHSEHNLDMGKAEPVTAAMVPDGWKLVPVEPTEAMLNAAWVSHGIYHPSAYRTMLAAAPAAPEQEV